MHLTAQTPGHNCTLGACLLCKVNKIHLLSGKESELKVEKDQLSIMTSVYSGCLPR